MALGTTALLKKRWLQLLDRDDFPLDTSLTNASGNTIYADAIRVKRAETAPGASHPDTIPVADVPAGLRETLSRVSEDACGKGAKRPTALRRAQAPQGTRSLVSLGKEERRAFRLCKGKKQRFLDRSDVPLMWQCGKKRSFIRIPIPNAVAGYVLPSSCGPKIGLRRVGWAHQSATAVIKYMPPPPRSNLRKPPPLR